jgi:hypothetical protein
MARNRDVERHLVDVDIEVVEVGEPSPKISFEPSRSDAGPREGRRESPLFSIDGPRRLQTPPLHAPTLPHGTDRQVWVTQSPMNHT